MAIADEDEVLRALIRDNPWWNDDPSPLFPSFPVKRVLYRLFKGISLNWNLRRSVILMGPRRAGKTVMLWQLFKDLLDDGFSRQHLFFASLDNPPYANLSLDSLIALFERQTGHAPHDKRVIVFDEIQYLDGWERHLKVLTDRYPNTRFIASGSAAAALRRQSNESGAGRFTDILLPPVMFSEFLAFRNRETELITASPVGDTIDFTSSAIDELNREFIDYMNFGGYPEAILNPDVRLGFDRFVGQDIVDKVLLRDLPSLYGIQDTQELNRLLSMIAFNTGREFNLDELCKSSGISKNTISRYLEYLEAAFLVRRVRRVDDSAKTFQRERHFKIFLTNPSLRSALFGAVKDGDNTMGQMVETAIVSQMLRWADRTQVYYARWKEGRRDLEIDVVLMPAEIGTPTSISEIKWTDRAVDKPTKLDFAALTTFQKKHAETVNIVEATTKTIEGEVTVQGVPIKLVPSALYCYILGKTVEIAITRDFPPSQRNRTTSS